MKPRIIVIDDNDGIRQALTLLLEKYGYEVIPGAEPTICPVYSVKGSCPHEDVCGDFLLTDNQMPIMTGLEFIETQSQKGCKGVMTCKAVMSGTWSSEDLLKAEKLGCKIFFKPLRIEEIIQWLEDRKKLITPGRKLAVISSSS